VKSRLVCARSSAVVKQAVKAEVDRLFAEAEAAVKNPSIAAYKAVEEWRRERVARPAEPHEEEALDSHLTTLLERNNLDAHQRAVIEGLLWRQDQGGADNRSSFSNEVQFASVGSYSLFADVQLLIDFGAQLDPFHRQPANWISAGTAGARGYSGWSCVPRYRPPAAASAAFL
jgi:hypothetical protein